MPFLPTHLLWGYVISRWVTKDPRYIAVGMSMAVLPDLDVVLPLASHHGFLHTPLFALVVAVSLYGGSSDRTLFRVCALGILGHLLLDTIASGSGLMWLYPASEAVLPLGHSLPTAAQVVVRVFLFVVPLEVVLKWYRAGEGSPLDVLQGIRAWVGDRAVGVLAAPAMVFLVHATFTNKLPWILCLKLA